MFLKCSSGSIRGVLAKGMLSAVSRIGFTQDKAPQSRQKNGVLTVLATMFEDGLVLPGSVLRSKPVVFKSFRLGNTVGLSGPPKHPAHRQLRHELRVIRLRAIV